MHKRKQSNEFSYNVLQYERTCKLDLDKLIVYCINKKQIYEFNNCKRKRRLCRYGSLEVDISKYIGRELYNNFWDYKGFYSCSLCGPILV